ncbi:MAG TPA: glycerophosphoryl diester phosphodiesterase membrane domain-containing protein [Caulobacteraceae bacterium]
MSLESQSPQKVLERIDVGRILSAAFAALRLRLGDLLAVAVFFLLVPQVLLGFAPEQFPDPQSAVWTLMAALPSLVFNGAASLILYGALTNATGPTAAEAIRSGVLKLSHLFVVGLLGGLAILAGLVLVAPGLYLAAGWLVATPLLMIENTSAIEALKQSHRLSQGSRWRLLGVILMLTAITVGLATVGVSILSVVTLVASNEIVKRVSIFIVGPVLAVVVRLVLMAVVTSAYAELKRVGGGMPATQVDQTFG